MHKSSAPDHLTVRGTRSGGYVDSLCIDNSYSGRETGNMSNDAVWYSNAMIKSSNYLGLTSEISINDVDNAIAMYNRNNAGEALPMEMFPSVIFGDGDTEKFPLLPHFFLAGSFWCVSKTCADVLR